MNISLKSETLEFVEQEVKAGHFRSVDELLEAAISLLMADEDLDDETIAAINLAEDQLDRGEGMEFDVFAAKMRKKYKSI